jgi:hypothetical protein
MRPIHTLHSLLTRDRILEPPAADAPGGATGR